MCAYYALKESEFISFSMLYRCSIYICSTFFYQVYSTSQIARPQNITPFFNNYHIFETLGMASFWRASYSFPLEKFSITCLFNCIFPKHGNLTMLHIAMTTYFSCSEIEKQFDNLIPQDWFLQDYLLHNAQTVGQYVLIFHLL